MRIAAVGGFVVIHPITPHIPFDLTLPKCGTAWAPDTTCAGIQGTTYMTDASVAAFGHQLLDRLRAMPGTQSAALSMGAPFTEWAINQGTIAVVGEPPPPRDRPNVIESKIATQDYFRTLGIRIVRGRDFTDADRRRYTERDAREVNWVGIVSEGAEKAYFNGNAVGKRIHWGGTGTMEIVGVVGDAKTESLNGEPEPALYAAFWQEPVFYITGLVRSNADAGTVMRAIRADSSTESRRRMSRRTPSRRSLSLSWPRSLHGCPPAEQRPWIRSSACGRNEGAAACAPALAAPAGPWVAPYADRTQGRLECAKSSCPCSPPSRSPAHAARPRTAM